MGGPPAPRRQGVGGLSYPRRQQLRRLARAAGAAAASALAVILAVAAALAGLTLIACALLFAAVASGLYARHCTRLAGRAAVGARSEAQVRRALAALERGGWRLRHALPWQRADIDHVAIAPTGKAFAIETKSRRYEPRHLDTVRAQAAWLRRRRRRCCPNGAGAVLCLTRGPRCEGHDRDVLVVSVDRLVCPQRCAWPPARSSAPPSWSAVHRRARAATSTVKTPRKARQRTRDAIRVYRRATHSASSGCHRSGPRARGAAAIRRERSATDRAKPADGGRSTGRRAPVGLQVEVSGRQRRPH